MTENEQFKHLCWFIFSMVMTKLCPVSIVQYNTQKKNKMFILMWWIYENMKLGNVHAILQENRWYESSWIKLKIWLVLVNSYSPKWASVINPMLKICYDISQEGLCWISCSSLKMCPSCGYLAEKSMTKICYCYDDSLKHLLCYSYVINCRKVALSVLISPLTDISHHYAKVSKVIQKQFSSSLLSIQYAHFPYHHSSQLYKLFL